MTSSTSGASEPSLFPSLLHLSLSSLLLPPYAPAPTQSDLCPSFLAPPLHRPPPTPHSHALQLRQAKLCFPSVHLIIGVCSDTLCSSHKAPPALTHAERCESVSHCRWVDQVAPDAPWELTQEFMDKYEIDYVAHDEEPYKAKGMEDVYGFVKKQGE